MTAFSHHSRKQGKLQSKRGQPVPSGNPEALITDNLDIWSSAIKTRSAAGRGSSKKLTLHGIKKLRELILELAVRGLLVPQDPNDESASVLLKKIAAEKVKLVEEGKIKKQKVLSPIGENEELFEMPKGWEWVRLQELVTLLGDGLHGTPDYSESGSYFFVNGNNLKEGLIYIKPETKKVNEAEYLKYKKNLNERTVLVSINGTLGNVAFYNNEPVMLGKSACYFNLGVELSKSYIKRLIESPYFLGYAFKNASGSTIKNLGLKAMNDFPVALPPLQEQHRIVTKVDELMALCDQLEQQQENSITAHQTLVENLLAALTNAPDNKTFESAWARIDEHFDTLFTTEHSINQLKQTILQLAVMGKLVPQNPNDEPASVLLEKIKIEKERLVKEGKIKKQKELPVIDEGEKPFVLPVGWEWVRLGTLLKKITDGTHHSPPNGDAGEYLYISAKNIKVEGVQLSNATYVTKELHEEIYGRCDPEFGDILYIKDGATTGIVTINNLHEPFSMLSSVALLKCPNGLLNKYFLHVLKSPVFYQEMRAGMTGVAITRVTLKKLNNAFIPLAPPEEQHRIVTKANELMTLCDNMLERIKAAQTTQLHLTDTVVGGALG